MLMNEWNRGCENAEQASTLRIRIFDESSIGNYEFSYFASQSMAAADSIFIFRNTIPKIN